MGLGRQGDQQGTMYLAWDEIPRSRGHAFYDRLGVTSPHGNLCTLRVPQGSQVSLDDVLAETPNVVTREIDVLPAQRG